MDSLSVPADVKAQLQEVADGMLQVYRTLVRMRYLEPEWIEEGPHALPDDLVAYCRSDAVNLDDAIIHLYSILPYVGPRHIAHVDFFQGSYFADFRHKDHILDGRDPLFLAHADEPAHDVILRPWMTPLSLCCNHNSVLIYDAKKHVIGIYDQMSDETRDHVLLAAKYPELAKLGLGTANWESEADEDDSEDSDFEALADDDESQSDDDEGDSDAEEHITKQDLESELEALREESQGPAKKDVRKSNWESEAEEDDSEDSDFETIADESDDDDDDDAVSDPERDIKQEDLEGEIQALKADLEVPVEVPPGMNKKGLGTTNWETEDEDDNSDDGDFVANDGDDDQSEDEISQVDKDIKQDLESELQALKEEIQVPVAGPDQAPVQTGHQITIPIREKKGAYDDMEARPAAEVLRDMVRWYEELVELPGGENSGAQWSHDTIKPLYIKNGWPASFDGDAFLVDMARAEAKRLTEGPPLTSSIELITLRRKVEDTTAIQAREDKLAAAKTPDEEWLARWDMFVWEQDKRRCAAVAARVDKAAERDQAELNEPLLREVKHLAGDWWRAREKVHTLQEELKEVDAGQREADPKRQLKLTRAERETATYHVAHGVARDEAEQLFPGRAATLRSFLEGEAATYAASLAEHDAEVQEMQEWLGRLPAGADEAKKAIEDEIKAKKGNDWRRRHCSAIKAVLQDLAEVE